MEAHVSTSIRCLSAVSSVWFELYISTGMGAIHDCYIAEYDLPKKEMKFPGSLHTFDTPTRDSSDGCKDF